MLGQLLNNNELKEVVQNVFEFNFGVKPAKSKITLLEAESRGYYILARVGVKEVKVTCSDYMNLPRYLPNCTIEIKSID